MVSHHFETLSEDQRETARSALKSVLGSVPLDAMIPLAGGVTTAAVFRVDAGGRRYLLRAEGEPNGRSAPAGSGWERLPPSTSWARCYLLRFSPEVRRRYSMLQFSSRPPLTSSRHRAAAR